MLAAPLLLIAVGLIIVFRANIWNLGYDGQYLLGRRADHRPRAAPPELAGCRWPMSSCSWSSMAAGRAWTISPRC